MQAFPELSVGDAIPYESLVVFPLFAPGAGAVDYVLADEAIAAGAVSVEEVSEGGSVPQLLVSNTSDERILFVEGEELRGAKQNRVLNTSVLVAARSKTKIPVSCVEQGRWRYHSRQFSSGGTHSSSKLRHFLKESVSNSLREGMGHMSDQMAVWNEVSRQSAALGAFSETGAMSDTYDKYRARLAAFQEKLKYVPGATGLAVAVGRSVVSVDVFDKPATCAKVWDRLLTGVAMDALETDAPKELACASDVETLLRKMQEAAWEPAPAVGEGQELRTEADPRTHASALVFEDSVLHGSVVVAT